MLEVIANALRSPYARLIQDGCYQNEQGRWGYYVTMWHASHYHIISVSHAETSLTLRVPHYGRKPLGTPAR